jgi:hypothetical protein
MSAQTVYNQVRQVLHDSLAGQVPRPTVTRLAVLVTGMIRASSAAPARVARAVDELHLSEASAESTERRVRRAENDKQVTAGLCFHPFARRQLLVGRPAELVLILDPTLQEDRVVMLSAAVWYRGRALPLAWALWPANTPLEGANFWQRVAALLDLVASLLPAHVAVTWLADRAFGSPVFTDLIVAHGWHYVVRVQGQTRYQDASGRCQAIAALVSRRGERRKLGAQVFKKAGWRCASVIAYWGRHHDQPLCLVSDLPPHWHLIALYRRRYPIEAAFRDYKSAGWRWEQGQVTNLQHVERLLVAMALATWLALMAGCQVASELLAHPATGQRRTRPYHAKLSLFHLGLDRLNQWLSDRRPSTGFAGLSDWQAPNWQTQISQHHAKAYVFAHHPHVY